MSESSLDQRIREVRRRLRSSQPLQHRVDLVRARHRRLLERVRQSAGEGRPDPSLPRSRP